MIQSNMMGYPAIVKQVLNSEDPDNPYDICDVIRFEIPGMTDNIDTFPFALPLQCSNSEVMEGDPIFVIQPSRSIRTWFYLKINRQEFFGISTRTGDEGEEQFIRLWESFKDTDKKKGIEIKDKFGNTLLTTDEDIQIGVKSKKLVIEVGEDSPLITMTFDATSEGNKFSIEDKNNNSIVLDNSKLELTSGSPSKSIKIDSAGITLTGVSGKIEVL